MSEQQKKSILLNQKSNSMEENKLKDEIYEKVLKTNMKIKDAGVLTKELNLSDLVIRNIEEFLICFAHRQDKVEGKAKQSKELFNKVALDTQKRHKRWFKI